MLIIKSNKAAPRRFLFRSFKGAASRAVRKSFGHADLDPIRRPVTDFSKNGSQGRTFIG